jgi:hypothetical protein
MNDVELTQRKNSVSREGKKPTPATEETAGSMFQMLKGAKFENRLHFETGETSHEKLMTRLHDARVQGFTSETIIGNKRSPKFRKANEESDESFWKELSGNKLDTNGRQFETGETSFERLQRKIGDPIYYSGGREKEIE